MITTRVLGNPVTAIADADGTRPISLVPDGMTNDKEQGGGQLLRRVDRHSTIGSH
ncbi:hypothetical protein [Herbidospora sp. RD11066]